MMAYMGSLMAISCLTTFLHSDCGICHHCIGLLIESCDALAEVDREEASSGSYCTVCFGLTSTAFHKSIVMPEIRRSLIPYCSRDDGMVVKDEISPLIDCKHGNYLSRESPTLQIPLLVQVRVHCAIAAVKSFLESHGTSKVVSTVHTNAEQVYLAIKESIKSSLKDMCHTSISKEHADESQLSEIMHNEEAGYLSIHTIIIPPQINSATNDDINDQLERLIPPSLQSYILHHQLQIQSKNYKILHPRTRFRGNDPTLKQGGDPRKNLELRLRQQSFAYSVWNTNDGNKRRKVNDPTIEKEEFQLKASDWNAILSWLDKDTVQPWSNQDAYSTESAEWLQQLHASNNKSSTEWMNCSVNATTWRRPFCIHGYYTKTRRDLSQTPFYVSPPPSSVEAERRSNAVEVAATKQSKSNSMIRKGLSSVEEEICPQLSSIGCNGISTMNNDSNSLVVYGMCKFHASGREDIDVRMLLPHPLMMERSDAVITGRPFVCEVIDAYHLPTIHDLKCVEDKINGQHTTLDGTTKPENDIEWDERGWPHSLVETNRSYGNNANGVGVHSLKFVPSNVFSTLQSETENKVKHYGCICWSESSIGSDLSLCQKLGCSSWNDESTNATTNEATTIYPLEIQQSTPLRVLHRRSSDIRTRFILTLSARRIDEHWFQLRMSTSAGTYVKEFVHGDCGRTYPSIRSMMGGRVDITELDCEGIVTDADA
ncbi:hypothetical protein ACHAXN_008385 [Cyclotella atomus]